MEALKIAHADVKKLCNSGKKGEKGSVNAAKAVAKPSAKRGAKKK